MKILSLDGGGVFGVGQALILSQIDNSNWDLVCGTSIGSAIAAFIATGKKIDVNFFREHMPEIFKPSVFRNPLWTSKYSDAYLNKILSEIFKGERLKDAQIPIYITASSINGHSPKVFSSLSIEDGTMFINDCVRASCAAQTYFKPWQGYGDGGIFTNNPSMVAVTWAMREFGIGLDGIELCSIGTGTFSRSCLENGESLLYWGNWMVRSLFEGGADKLFDEMASSLPLKRYDRYQFVKRPYWKIDNVEHMMEAIGDWMHPALDHSLEIKHGILASDEYSGEMVTLNTEEANNFNKAMKL